MSSAGGFLPYINMARQTEIILVADSHFIKAGTVRPMAAGAKQYPLAEDITVTCAHRVIGCSVLQLPVAAGAEIHFKLLKKVLEAGTVDTVTITAGEVTVGAFPEIFTRVTVTDKAEALSSQGGMCHKFMIRRVVLVAAKATVFEYIGMA
jgi:hypothetical protein